MSSSTTSSVAVIAQFAPRPECREAVRMLLKGMTSPTRAEVGCRTYDVYECPSGDDFVLFERYRDRCALDAHRASAHYVEYRANIAGLLIKPIEVTVLDVVDEAP